MELSNVLLIARKELRDALRNRWVLLYTICFTILMLVMAGVSVSHVPGTSAAVFASFGRTVAGMINLMLLFVPLMALTTSAGSIASERERGTMSYLLAQPLHRIEVLAGKFLGLWAALGLILALSFGVSAIFIGSGSAVACPLLRLFALTSLLAGAMLSVGLLISCLCRRVSVATGTALFVWLTLVFLSDLGLMGSVLIFRLRIENLFYIASANPMQAFKMLVLGSLHTSLDVLGPAGLFATQTLGSLLTWLLAGVLVAWIVLPLLLAWGVFARRGEA